MQVAGRQVNLGERTGGVYRVARPDDGLLVLSVFDDEGAAEIAQRAVRRRLASAPSGDSLSVGVLVKRPDGSIPTWKLGPRVVDSHPGVGAPLSVIAQVVDGEDPLLGHLPPSRSHKTGPARNSFCEGFGLNGDDVSRLGAELDAGRAVVAILANTPEGSSWAIVELTELGGKTEVHLVSDEHLERAAEVAASRS